MSLRLLLLDPLRQLLRRCHLPLMGRKETEDRKGEEEGASLGGRGLRTGNGLVVLAELAVLGRRYSVEDTPLPRRKLLRVPPSSGRGDRRRVVCRR